jgi:hypothetical protein
MSKGNNIVTIIKTEIDSLVSERKAIEFLDRQNKVRLTEIEVELKVLTKLLIQYGIQN